MFERDFPDFDFGNYRCFRHRQTPSVDANAILARWIGTQRFLSSSSGLQNTTTCPRSLERFVLAAPQGAGSDKSSSRLKWFALCHVS
jgi:hypothetical protein